MSNNISKKILYYINISCKTPICVANGNDGETDNDVLRDYNGNPFVSGSTLAGAFRDYFGYMKYEDCIFGYSASDGINGRMSQLFISDLRFNTESIKVHVRNGVELSDSKTAITGHKFDYEVVDSGVNGQFIMELIIRDGDKDSEEEKKKQIYRILNGLESGEIRLGTKKNRGFGRLVIKKISVKEFTKDNILDYRDAYNQNIYSKLEDSKDEIIGHTSLDKYIKICVPLKLEGGISIREYSAIKGLPDFIHIKANNTPVIPGTGIAGAIRHRIKSILDELEIKNSDKILNKCFGYVDGNKAHISNIIFDESKIEKAHDLQVVRNAISRFECATKDGALYKELASFEGTTEINIMVKRNIKWSDNQDKDNCDITNLAVGLLLLAIKDIQNGYLPVGGQTAIGRGILSNNGDITIDGKKYNENEYMVNVKKLREELG